MLPHHKVTPDGVTGWGWYGCKGDLLITYCKTCEQVLTQVTVRTQDARHRTRVRHPWLHDGYLPSLPAHRAQHPQR